MATECFRSKMTDSVLLFLGTLFFLVFLLCRLSIRFRGSCVRHGLLELCRAGCHEPWRRVKCPR